MPGPASLKLEFPRDTTLRSSLKLAPNYQFVSITPQQHLIVRSLCLVSLLPMNRVSTFLCHRQVSLTMQYRIIGKQEDYFRYSLRVELAC